jgi:hypothetical protein
VSNIRALDILQSVVQHPLRIAQIPMRMEHVERAGEAAHRTSGISWLQGLGNPARRRRAFRTAKITAQRIDLLHPGSQRSRHTAGFHKQMLGAAGDSRLAAITFRIRPYRRSQGNDCAREYRMPAVREQSFNQ